MLNPRTTEQLALSASIPNQLLNLTPRSEQHHLSPVRLPDSAPLGFRHPIAKSHPWIFQEFVLMLYESQQLKALDAELICLS